jgi:two-component system, NtrC family, sensor kinase
MSAAIMHDGDSCNDTFMGQPARPIRILIVDDDSRIVSALSRMLPASCDAAFAFSGGQAMQLIQEDDNFDVILSDLMMPDQSGMEFHAWLAQTHPFLASRVIFITGYAWAPPTRQFLKRVPNDYLEKPSDSLSLLALIALVAQGRGVSCGPDNPRQQDWR